MSPRSPEQFEQLRQQSRERILQSALRLFARFGYERTSVRAIAKEAGVAQGLMYNYFAGKEDLLRAIFARGMENVHESLASAPVEARPGERLENLIRGSMEIVRLNRDFWSLSYSIRTQPAVLHELAEMIGGWSETIRGQIEAIFRAAGVSNPGTEAAILFALIDGIAQHYVLEPEQYPLDQVVSAVVAKYRDGAMVTLLS